MCILCVFLRATINAVLCFVVLLLIAFCCVLMTLTCKLKRMNEWIYWNGGHLGVNNCTITMLFTNVTRFKLSTIFCSWVGSPGEINKQTECDAEGSLHVAASTHYWKKIQKGVSFWTCLEILASLSAPTAAATAAEEAEVEFEWHCCNCFIFKYFQKAT